MLELLWEPLPSEVSPDTNQDLKDDVNKSLAEVGREYKGTAKVQHVITALYEDYKPEVMNLSVAPLHGLKAAPFYGCHLFLPQRYTKFDDSDFPEKLGHLIEMTGAEAIDYHEKSSCCIGCGSFFGKVSEDASLKLAEVILDDVKRSGADAIVATCPFCMMQLEVGQMKLKEEKSKVYDLPVFHYVDILGLSMGLKPEELGLGLRRLDSSLLLKRLER